MCHAIAVCGNGVLELACGEACDDGNAISGDCCSAVCTIEPPGSVCGADVNPCTDDVCNGAGSCTHPENSAPCEDTTRLSYGGIVYHMAVDVAPQRRVDVAMRLLTEGARKASLYNPRTLEECLAEELILAAGKDVKSYAIAKRNEIERVARSSR